VLTRYFLEILKVESLHGDAYVEKIDWIDARAKFSIAHDLYSEYGLTVPGGWTPYKEKAKSLLAEKTCC
jgi:hypothetical protein